MNYSALFLVMLLLVAVRPAAAHDGTNQAMPVISTNEVNGTQAPEARAKAIVLINHARLDFANGRLDDAEKKLRGALVLDPNALAANYYLTLIRERRQVFQNASVRPIYPVIRKLDGSLEYGIPADKRPLREVADDLKGN